MNCKNKIEKINLSVKGSERFEIKLNLSQRAALPFQIDGQFPSFVSKINEGNYYLIIDKY